MSSGVFEQSQTNLAHRLNDRIDIRTVKRSTTLDDVDCGKHFYISVTNDMTLTLPNALKCIGGAISGFVTQAGSGTNTLTIATRDNEQLTGNRIATGTTVSYASVPVGFSFTATSSGKNWCLTTAGSFSEEFGAITSGAIVTDSLKAKSVNTSLLLNGNGPTAGIVTNNATINIASSRANTDSFVGLDGPTSNGRYIACYQAGVYKCNFGLANSAYYFITDVERASEMFRARLGGGQCIEFPSYANGDLSIITGGIVSSASDRRLKTEEQALDSADSLQKIMNLQPKTFKWLTDLNRQEIGFIAQDVEAVIPNAVDAKRYPYEFAKDSKGVVQLGENGEPVMDRSRPRYRGLSQAAILSTLVSAFQKSVQRINALEARLSELESRQ